MAQPPATPTNVTFDNNVTSKKYSVITGKIITNANNAYSQSHLVLIERATNGKPEVTWSGVITGAQTAIGGMTGSYSWPIAIYSVHVKAPTTPYTNADKVYSGETLSVTVVSPDSSAPPSAPYNAPSIVVVD